MRLVPVTGVLAVVNKAAQSSPRGAAELVRLGLYEAMCDLAKEHRGTVEPTLLAHLEKSLAAERGRLLRTTVAKALDGADTSAEVERAKVLATLTEQVEKSLWGDILRMFNEQHPRDDKGRFIGVESGQGPTEARRNTSLVRGAAAIDEAKQSKRIDDKTPVTVRGATYDEDGNKDETREFSTTAENWHKDVKAQGDDFVMHQIELPRRKGRGQESLQQDTIDMLSTFTGKAPAGGIGRGLVTPEGGARGQTGNAQRWHGRDSGTDRQGYRQLSMTGQALRSVSVPGSTMNTAGTVAQLVGDIGPEAEKILAPGLRRTAYRYRGTERRPDREVYTQVRDATAYAENLETAERSKDPERKAKALAELTPAVQPGAEDYSANIAANWAGERSADKRALRMRGDTAVAYLLGGAGGPALSHLPSPEQTELSIASGEVPPSEGILIDANGRVHSQAVGYNGDHYLPFDLKNINALFGGQYARTRAAGGPSTEDIYTGLMTGARQLQVVSNSGVFTVEFDPDLRGGRRYSDKAARMVSRYGDILDTIASEELYERDVSDKRKAELRTQISGLATDQADFDARFKRSLEHERMVQSFRDVDNAELEEAADNYAQAKTKEEEGKRGGMTTRQRAYAMDAHRREFMTEQGGNEVKRLRLDGPGYERALKTLKQEFPYYIRQATYESLPDWLNRRQLNRGRDLQPAHRFAPDRGYVQPGQTNPLFAQASLHAAGPKSKAKARRVPTQWPREEQTASTVTTNTTAPSGPTPGVQEGERTGSQLVAASKKQGGHYFNQLRDTIRKTVQGLDEDAKVGGLKVGEYGPRAIKDEEEGLSTDVEPVEYARWKWDTLGRNADRFAAWYVTAPVPAQRKILDALTGVKKGNADLQPPIAGYEPENLDKNWGRLAQLTKALHPFQEPEDSEGTLDVFSIPNQNDPKPVKFDWDVDMRPEEFTRQQDILKLDEPDTFSALREMDRGASDAEIALELANRIDSWGQTVNQDTKAGLEREIVATHRAWSFRTARDTAKIFQAPGGGAVPLAPSPGSASKADLRPRRVLVFHEPPGAPQSQREPVG